MNYKGTIIKESLNKQDVLGRVKILSTKIERVVNKHKTPWLKQWTLYTVEIGSDKAAKVAEELSRCMEQAHSWYADFKNDEFHFVVFRNKIFRIDRTSKKQYDEVKDYGVLLGIPSYQVDFHPEVKKWRK